jgi:hypothetical protein
MQRVAHNEQVIASQLPGALQKGSGMLEDREIGADGSAASASEHAVGAPA